MIANACTVAMMEIMRSGISQMICREQMLLRWCGVRIAHCHEPIKTMTRIFTFVISHPEGHIIAWIIAPKVLDKNRCGDRMSRYIDAENIEPHEIYEDGFVMVAYMDDIDAMPTADVVPVKHGYWKDTGSGQECSVCGEIQYGYDSGRHYCQNCGAKVDERMDE